MVDIERIPIRGLRHPIVIESPNQNLPPENLDTEDLLVRFVPLMKSVYRYFSSYVGIFNQYNDYEDLYSQIQFEFCKLCMNYNPNYGVDFLGYIKLHLQNRVYHYVTKQQKVVNKEILRKSFTSGGNEERILEIENFLNLVDLEPEREFDRVEAIASLDWKAVTGKKHKQLIQGVLFERKSLEELAEREGVSIKVMRLRMYFACNKLVEYAKRRQMEVEETCKMTKLQ